MRNLKLTSLFLLITFLFSTNVFALEYNTTDLTKEQKKIVEKNLLIGLESDNKGLQISSANFLGEYRLKNAVVPLMKVLRNSECNELKIQAALALIKIGDGRGVYAVKQAINYDKNSSVRRFCNIFYSAYTSNQVSFK